MKRLVSVERREETTKRFYQKKDSKINSFHSLANEKDTENKNENDCEKENEMEMKNMRGGEISEFQYSFSFSSKKPIGGPPPSSPVLIIVNPILNLTKGGSAAGRLPIVRKNRKWKIPISFHSI